MAVPAAVSACFTVSPNVTVSRPTVDIDEFPPSVGVKAEVVVVSTSPGADSVGATVVDVVLPVGRAEHSVGMVVVGGEVVVEVVDVVATAVVVVVGAGAAVSSPPRVIMNKAALMTTMRAMRRLASCRNGIRRC